MSEDHQAGGDDNGQRLSELEFRTSQADMLGGEDAIAREHSRGRLTIRERIEKLVDPGSFREVGRLTGRGEYKDGKLVSVTPAPYVGGLATIAGRRVAIGGEDFTIRGGTSPGLARRKGGQGGFIEDLAHHYRVPLINLCHGGGGSVTSLLRKGYAPLPGEDGFERTFELLGEVPVIGALLGPSAGGPALRAIASHFSLMPRGTAQLMIAGPGVVERAVGEKLDNEQLGGASVAVDTAGTIDNAYDSEDLCFEAIRTFLSYMPQNAWELPPLGPRDDPPDRVSPELRDLVPERRTQPYKMHRAVELVMDEGSLFEIRPTFGRAVHCFLARLHGVPVGIIANNPMINGGALDVSAVRKQRHFIDMCNCFHLPIINFVDTPGFMVGTAAETGGAFREGMRCLQAGIDATVPFFTVILRKCYGGAGLMTQHKEGIDLKIAWPTGEWGSLPLQGGVAVAFRDEIESAPDPAAREREIENELAIFASPFRTAEVFGVEDVIDPAMTRSYLAAYIDAARDAMRPDLGPKESAVLRV